VRAADPVTAIYGAFGKFTLENGLGLDNIQRVMMTGVGASFLTTPIFSLDCRKVSEFSCVGRGGLYLSGLQRALVVSMGTGTAMVYADHQDSGTKTEYLGGTGMGGGTLMGLSRKMLGVDNIDHLEQLCEGGNLGNIDLRIQDISDVTLFPDIKPELTASNFGKLSDIASKNDIARGIVNMVSETVLMMAVFAARSRSITDIVLTGNLTRLESVRSVFETLGESFGVTFHIPKLSQFATVIGAALQPNP
jgi:type II pantothenate kinase